MLFQQAAEFEQCGRIRHRLAAQVDAGKASQAGTVVERFLVRQIRQVEPVLQEMNAQHSLQPNRRQPISFLWIMRLDDRAQCIPGNDPVHPLQKHIAPGRLAMLFNTVVCCHR